MDSSEARGQPVNDTELFFLKSKKQPATIWWKRAAALADNPLFRSLTAALVPSFPPLAHSLHQAEARRRPPPQRPRRALLLPRFPDNRPHAEGALEARATTAGLGSRPDSIDSIQFIFGEDAGDPSFSPVPPRPASMPWLRGSPRCVRYSRGDRISLRLYAIWSDRGLKLPTLLLISAVPN